LTLEVRLARGACVSWRVVESSRWTVRGRRVFGMAGPSVAEELAGAVGAPLVLVDRPGWRVEYADERTARSGTVRFVGPVTAGSPSAVELRWTDGGLSSLMRDRANSTPLTATAPVLGTFAHVYFRHGPGRQKISGLWEAPTGLVLEFVAIVNDLDEFVDLLGSLRIVEESAWLDALPPSTVRPADRASVVLSMLNGVSVPPGFDPSTTKGAGLVKDATGSVPPLPGWLHVLGSNDGPSHARLATPMACAKRSMRWRQRRRGRSS
jgi:hypothetical protein